MLIGMLNKVAANNANKNLQEKATQLFSGEAFKRDEKGNAPEPLVKGGNFAEKHPKLRDIGMGAAASLIGAKTMSGESGERVYQAGKSAKEGINGLQLAITEGLERNNNSISGMLKDDVFVDQAKKAVGLAQPAPEVSRPSLEEEQVNLMQMGPKP